MTMEGYDEVHAAPGVPRPHYAALLERLDGADLPGVRARVDASLSAGGVTFGPEPFAVDPIPRLLAPGEWATLAAGLEQRVRALNAFVADAYGARRIVAEGILPAAVLDGAEGFEPDLAGRLPPGAPPIGVAGLDVVREPGGALLVLEDNLRTPSGLAYAVAARHAVAEALGLDEPDPEGSFTLLGNALRATVPEDAGTEPCLVVLTDGPGGAAHWEHAEVARRLAAPLVTLDDLEPRGGGLALRDGGRRVDVVYRRSDEDRVRDDDGALTPVAALLLEPWTAGRVGVVNAFGTGVADDKLVHAHVEDMVRLYLGEEPLVESVPTIDLGADGALDEVLADLRAHVIKPRLGHGGHGVVVCGHAEEEDLRRVEADLRADPGGYIAQRTVTLSVHPTVVGDGPPEPRHVDLRPFVLAGADWCTTAPVALTRVAWDAGALVVNSSQDGGGKATWVHR
jgi:uncharacterized circularly permuted ATP-grasp superfamily protein